MKQAPWCAGALIPFEREISVLVRAAPMAIPLCGQCRRTSTSAAFSTSPSCRRASTAQGLPMEAQDPARRLVSALDYVGVLCVEMFVTADGLLLNEIAPRPHNSGHYTIEACVTAVRAAGPHSGRGTAGRYLMMQPAVMVNLLGDVV